MENLLGKNQSQQTIGARDFFGRENEFHFGLKIIY